VNLICSFRKNKKALEACHKILLLWGAQKLFFHKNNNLSAKAVNSPLRTAASNSNQWEAVLEVKFDIHSVH
jgi:hypothetical protein